MFQTRRNILEEFVVGRTPRCRRGLENLKGPGTDPICATLGQVSGPGTSALGRQWHEGDVLRQEKRELRTRIRTTHDDDSFRNHS